MAAVETAVLLGPDLLKRADGRQFLEPGQVVGGVVTLGSRCTLNVVQQRIAVVTNELAQRFPLGLLFGEAVILDPLGVALEPLRPRMRL